VTGSDDDSENGSGGAPGEFASEELGRAMSDRGGFGIASRIVQDLSSSGNKNLTGKVTGNLHVNTVMKTFK
jgi:Rod binding domain-containing protein